MGSKERAKERREKRLQEISLLRTIPYSDHQRFLHFPHLVYFFFGFGVCMYFNIDFLRKPISIPNAFVSNLCVFIRWWSSETIAVVTGGNRGIGFEISRQLAAHGLTVVLTSRDSNVGLEATNVLQEGGLNVIFHQLDVLDPLSIKQFSEWLQETYGGLDILVSFQYHNSLMVWSCLE
jgi:carbonyl reductase 1